MMMIKLPDPDEMDLMTIEEFKVAVARGSFNHYDGDGCWATATEMDTESSVWANWPSPPPWATHVAWFNK